MDSYPHKSLEECLIHLARHLKNIFGMDFSHTKLKEMSSNQFISGYEQLRYRRTSVL